MRKISPSVLQKMATLVSDEDRDEMAIPSYLHKNPAMRWMAWRRVEVVAKQIEKLLRKKPSDSLRVLDYGCGTGVFFEVTKEFCHEIVGVDLELRPAQYLIESQAIKNVSLVQANDFLESNPPPFDLIIAAEVLEHIEPVEPIIKKFHQWLKSDGELLVSLPTENSIYKLGRKLAGFKGHYHHQNAEVVHQAILKVGFKEQRFSKIPLPSPFDIYWVISYAK